MQAMLLDRARAFGRVALRDDDRCESMRRFLRF
jgi:hypothetical protein